ncbi:hypothetical protein Dshi_3924 (plasmid) [Dinoroseobacter shibae DFL 12 = DSM 16493]|jgi:hypothetical protein|uniref:Uncharacterized protein n=1 Tax=Dinoroseobacter shibae (strain DSM 16493 / NCIMB 14021 / DFL 12) TaxID=398580 RepID=A8LTT5_DINSH|nr:hypothetical protein [Dinoroseobacter shibae]ABV95652.1 hypothetical protein Dshi_3924 [Dinoroseobacter shibae DFL 12 = DSM 16493]URF48857.1 hypothetical protein M8008_20120 [Dinoroseobacter shibae]URF53169.1 hypothetical protein M8007_20145 [Dinoroseobacter shibae]
MSAPDTNLKTQRKRHIGALAGIGIAVAFAAILLAGYLVILADRGEAPEGADTQIDGRFGVEVEN